MSEWLPLLVLAESFCAERRQRHGALGVVCLRPDEPESSADTLECLNDFELSIVEVDVFPAQAEQFPTPQAEAQGEHVEGMEPIPGRGSQHGLCLNGRESAVHLVLGRGDLDELGDVARDGFFSDGALQGVPEHGVDGLDHPGRQPGLAALSVFQRAAARFPAGGVVSVLAALALLADGGDEDATSRVVSLSRRFFPRPGIG
jgi:hypothetical protein